MSDEYFLSFVSKQNSRFETWIRDVLCDMKSNAGIKEYMVYDYPELKLYNAKLVYDNIYYGGLQGIKFKSKQDFLFFKLKYYK